VARIAGAPGGIRTPNPQIRSLVLCPIELRARDELKFSDLGIALRKSENRSANGKWQSEDLDPAILRRYLSMSNKESKISNEQLVRCRCIISNAPKA
jgi:hypothetical protein